MRVAVIGEPIVSVPPNHYGGTEQVMYYLIKGLKELGHEPILLGTGDSTVDCELIPITPTAISFAPKKKDLAAHNRRIEQIHHNTKRLLYKLLPRIDIIHSHYFDLKSFRFFPSLTTMHNKVEPEQYSYFKARQSLYYAAISKSQQAAAPYINFAGVVYNGEDPNAFPYVAEPSNYVCFLGRFDRDKNPHLAIQLAIKAGIKIKLGGKIDYLGEEYFENEVAKYFDHPLVEYLGELDFEQKVELLSHAKANLHPIGFAEPFGLTVLEAAYTGTPTLAISKGAMPEVIEDGASGILVSSFENAEMDLQRCFRLDRHYVAARARATFNYHEMTKDYLRAYQYVLHDFRERKTSRSRLGDLHGGFRQQLQII